MALVHEPAVAGSQAPVVSVCVANYNGAALLPDCIGSVLAQAPRHALEIIVHDDASTDDSVRLLREAYPQVAVIASDENVGFCVANNRMVAQARGDYVLLLNNDAALAPDAIDSLLRAAATTGGPAVLTLPQYDWDTGRPVDRGCLLDPFYNPIPNLDPARRDVAYVIGACLWIPRTTWHVLGGFPEWLESIGEDLYLCLVARLAGVAVRAAPGSGYRHRQGASFGGNRAGAHGLRTTRRRRRLSERNKTIALAILTPTPLAWGLLAAHVPLLLLEGMLVATANRDASLLRDVYGRALAEAWTMRRTILAERKRLQATRRIPFHRFLSAFRPWPRKLVLLFRLGFPEVA